MAFFDNMKETLTTAGRDVSQKAKEVSGIAKLKLDIKSKEDALNKEYIALGKRYYDMHKEGEVADEQIANISSLLSEIVDLKEEIVRIQGGTSCPKCGAVVPEGSVYCNKCGTNVQG
ncbi:MAG: zinc ribbon domain-containing protein [Lachnospiraceae bacterium]|nr:zinc ribbon domain-containing protein [Lachnospiraceae bacterium]